MRRSASATAGLVVAAVLGLGACGGGETPIDTPSPVASSSAEPASPSASATPSATLATLPATQCLTGEWRLLRFVAAGGQTYGTGQGGDVTVTFDEGGYTLSGAGRKPIQVTLAGSTAQLAVDGRAAGTYVLDGSKATFTPKSASGSGTVTLGGRSRRLSMDQVLNVIGPSGDGEVACTADAMTITLEAVRLELGRA